MSGFINYVKKAFKDYPDKTTPITAANLNHLDDGIFNIDQALGSTDISEIGNGTFSGALASLNSHLTANSVKFVFAYDSTTGKYGYTIGGTFHPFSSGAIYLGEYSANATIDVSALGATSASQFIAVPQAVNYSREQGQGSGVYTLTYILNNPSMTLSNGVLSLSIATGSANYGTVTIPCKVYYVGDIETAN